jgi:N-acetylmuramoyl-L-alanine amidase
LVTLLMLVWLVTPVAAQDGPWYEVTCPTGTAQVVLDPGHGGPDPGAVQETYGLYEKTLTLEVTERVATILRADGYTIALTRASGEAELANSERGEIANACGASVFVEIHLNASLDTDVDAAQTFWAEKEKDIAFALVMNEALGAIGLPVRDVERFDNGGLLRARMPSVLVEAVFVTNGDEAKDLANGTRQESIARAVADGIDDWLTIAGEAAAPLPGTPASASPEPFTPATPVIATPRATPVALPLVYPPNAEVAGVSQAEWMSRRWRWLAGLPIGLNPGQDASGGSCDRGQGGPVYFIPGNMPPCTVPHGVAVLIPVAGSICTSADLPATGGDAGKLRDCAVGDTDRYTAIRVIVDGEEVPGIESYRFATDRFELTLPANNVLGEPAGKVEAVADGYQVIVPPMSPGEHEVIVHVELADGTVLPDKRLVLTVSGASR